MNVGLGDPNFKVIFANTSASLNGQPAYILVFETSDLTNGKEVEMQVGNDKYSILYWATKPDYSKYLPTVEKMIGTFQSTPTTIQRSSAQAARTNNTTSDTISKIVTCEQQHGALGTTQFFAYCAQKVAGVYINVSNVYASMPVSIDPYRNCLARYGQNVATQHGNVINICGQESDRIIGSNTTTAGPTSALSPSSTNPAELNQIRNATFLKCSQSGTMKHCFQQELQLYGNTLDPGVRALVQCETQHSMDYCFSNAGPVTGNSGRTPISHHNLSHPSGHTAAYNQGFSDGTTSARNSGINDPGSACDSFGYKGTDCSHYLQGYADGFNSNCSRSKFGCDGQGNPKLAP